MISIVNEQNIRIFHALTTNALLEGFKKKDLVNITGLRQIGKSRALSELSKEKNIPIVVSGRTMKELLLKEYPGTEYYTIEELKGSGIDQVLVEEGVRLGSLTDMCIEIITGYFSYEY